MQKIQFYLILCKKGSKNRAFSLFWKFCRSAFLKAVWKENYFESWLPTPNFLSDKIPFLELFSKVSYIDEIASFQKVYYFKLKWDMNGKKRSQSRVVHFFESFVNWHYWEQTGRRNITTLHFPSQIPCFVQLKSLVMLLTNLIVGFQNVQYFKNELRHEIVFFLFFFMWAPMSGYRSGTYGHVQITSK